MTALLCSSPFSEKTRDMEAGMKYTTGHTVLEDETADRIGSGGLPVYATPAMVALMERTAYTLARENGAETVGTRADISHIRACLPGTHLLAEAELTEVDGRRLVFRVEVSDGEGPIGTGTHERFVIDPERFMSRLSGK